MNKLFNHQDLSVLYVDREQLSLKYFRRAFHKQFHILTADSIQQGRQILGEQTEEIGLILAEQSMPNQTGLEFLEEAHHIKPRTMRILVITSLNPGLAEQALQSHTMHRYIYKPWNSLELELILRDGLKNSSLTREH